MNISEQSKSLHSFPLLERYHSLIAWLGLAFLWGGSLAAIALLANAVITIFA